jgi:hypothetical protein
VSERGNIEETVAAAIATEIDGAVADDEGESDSDGLENARPADSDSCYEMGRRLTEPDERNLTTAGSAKAKVPLSPDEAISRIAPQRHKPRPPEEPSFKSARYAHLRSAYGRRALPTRDPEHPPRAEPPARVRACITAALNADSLKGASTELLEATLIELQACRNELATAHRFKESGKYQRAITHVIACHLAKAKIEVQKAALDQHKVQTRELEQEARSYDHETKQLIVQQMTAQAEKREKLLESHKMERTEHNKEWDSVRRLRMYNRPSNRVTVLRHQQTLLTVQCRFEEADVLAKMINEVVKHDESEHARSRQIDYEESLTKLKTKQANELAFFDEHSVIEIAQLRQRRETLRKAIDNKEKKIEARGEVVKDIDRLWNAKQSERLEQLAAGESTGTALPSSHPNREEVAKTQGTFLSLPPLRLETDKSARRKKRKEPE